jgi:3-dehydroquinate synthase
MVKLTVNLLDRSYPIYITTNYTALNRCLTSSEIEGKIVVVTDSNVDKFQSQETIGILESGDFELYKYVIPAGEKNKNLDTVKNIYKFLMDLKLDRSSTLVALGGGVVGDITGFAAATFLRGINFVQVPTTLLAQADSSVGGKVGVDFKGSKNIIGSFYQPKFVYINVNTLRTLPKRELKSGLAEVIKHGIISDEDFYEYIVFNIDKVFSFDEDVLRYITKVNCTIKGRVVEQDEKEEGLRSILNFGHTIGHAIESVYQFELLHGECISIGMAGAFKMAMHLEMVDRKTAEKVENTLNKVGLPVRLNGMDVEKVYNQLFFDKKIKKSKLKFILPKKIGQVLQLTIEDEALIKNVLNDIAR